MIEILGFGLLALVGLVLCGVFCAVASVLCWIFWLPFKLLGFVFKGLAFLLALPIVVVLGLVGVVLFGVAMLAFFIPVLPLVLIALLVWWLVRRRSQPAPSVSV